MGVLRYYNEWSETQEITPEFPPDSNSISSDYSLASVSSLTTTKQPQTTRKHQFLTTFKSHTSSISSLILAENHLLSGSSDHQVRLWPRDSPPTTHNLIAHTESPVISMAISSGKLFTGHLDHKIRVWKLNSNDVNDPNNQPKTLDSTYLTMLPTTKMFSMKVKSHSGAVATLAVSNNGEFLYSGSFDSTFKVWRTSDFKCVETINAHEDVINAIVVSKEGFVYTGSGDRKIKVWKRFEGEKKHVLVDVLEKHKSGVNALALSSDGSVLYSGACERSILVWERGSGERHMAVAGALRGHTKGVLSVMVVGELVVSGSLDKTVRVWRGIGGKKYCRVCVLEGHNGPVKCLAGGLEGDDGGGGYVLYSGSLDCDVKVWKVWVPLV